MELQIPELKDIRESIDSLYRILDVMIASGKAKKTVTVDEIAKMEGVSNSQIRQREKYLLPRFGESGYPEGPRRWDFEEYLEWRKIPPEERKKAWQQSLREELIRTLESRGRT